MDRLTVQQLKEQLRLRGRKCFGNKGELIERLAAVLQSEGKNVDTFARDFHVDDNGSVTQDNSSGPLQDNLARHPSQDAHNKLPSTDDLQHAGDVENLEASISPSDSASNIGVNSQASRLSKTSNVSSKARMVASAKRAGLEAKLAKLKQLEELELEELRIKQRRERLLLEAECAKVKAQEEVLIKGKGSVLKKENRPSISSRKSLLEGCELAGQGENSESSMDSNMMKSLISCSLKGLMPAQEIVKFDGDHTKYHRFIRSFDNIISVKLTTDEERLHYLDQYTTGRPNEIVSACLHLNASEGYSKARDLLHKRYGNPEQIATAYLDRVLNWRSIGRDDIDALEEYSVTLISCRNAVSCVPFGFAELQNPKTMRIILAKLPFYLQEKFRRIVDDILVDQGRTVLFDDLVSFVEKETRILKNPLFGRHLFDTSKEKNFTKNKASSSGKENQSNVGIKVSCHNTKGSLTCWYCKDSHLIDDCNEIKLMSHDRKLSVLREKRLCFSCLRSGHLSKFCKNRKKCSECQGNHPTLLHFNTKGDNANHRNSHIIGGDTDTTCGDINDVAIFSSVQGGSCAGMSVVPVRVRTDDGTEVITRAFLDGGSSASFCSRQLLERLGKNEFSDVQLTVTTVHGEKNMYCSLVPGLFVSDFTGNDFISLPPLYTIEKIPIDKCDIVRGSDLVRWPHFSNVFIPDVDKDVEVGLLIGNNVPHAMEPKEVIGAPCDFEPFAMRTKLGWVICGAKQVDNGMASINKITIRSKEVGMDGLLIEMYNRDFQDLACCDREMSYEDKKWLNIVETGCRRVQGKYEIPLPLRAEIFDLPDSRKVALRRMYLLKRKFIKDEIYALQYCSFMREMLSNGYAELVPDIDKSKERVWYLPHFGVKHPDKPNKVRIVFDCAAKIDGLSLNDLIIQGPDIMNSLIGVLLRFRVGLFAYIGDINTMFYQVKVPPCDRDYLRFYWWTDENFYVEPQEYRMAVHLFGACSSPSVANFALKHIADDFAGKFSVNTCDTVRNSFYVDDCLHSEDSLLDLIDNVRELRQLCSLGGFCLSKFISPSKEFLASLQARDLGRGMEQALGLDSEMPKVKALGVVWDLSLDRIGSSVNVMGMPTNKRQLLSLIASVYDPLGILSPFVLEGRMIMQEMCRIALGWDEAIPKTLFGKVKNWLEKAELCNSISVPRCIKPLRREDIASVQLHVFSDASEFAYGTVSYLRLVDVNDIKYCVFLMGKSRVGPLKTVTIPRLELTAATLSVKIIQTVKDSIDLKLEKIYFWTDSTTVLRYIKNDTTRFQTFVANRVEFIRSLTAKDQWYYVNSEANPADDASRGKQTPRWCGGPEFLLQEQEFWPKDPNVTWNDLEGLEVRHRVNRALVSEVKQPLDKLIDCYSDWYRLCRGVAWLIMFVKYMLWKFGKGAQVFLGCTMLSFQVIKKAEFTIIKLTQSRTFADLIFNVGSGRNIPKTDSLRKLNPVLCEGILRVGGRLERADLDFDEKYPIIMPYKSHVTDLLIRMYHEQFGHMGRMYILSKLRERFWVIKGNAAVRRVISTCVKCRKLKGRVIQQQMSVLPSSRVEADNPPFHTVGIDYFGPFYVKRGRAQVKRWGVIFTCLVIRAVHLEVAVDMSSGSFINVFRRFVARRGQVKHVKCDRGRNFVGSCKFISREMEDEMHRRGIEFDFNPPGASHFGGTWERMIRSVREILDAVLGSQAVDEDGLHTLFCEIEAIVNSRPISAVSSDPCDISAISPNKLLNLGMSPVDVCDSGESSYSKQRWAQVQYLAQQFWCKWKSQYLLGLQERQKWFNKERNVNVGDIVLIVNVNEPRCHWPLARVVETKFSKDGLVRSVIVKCGKKTYERPLSKLIMILENETQNISS